MNDCPIFPAQRLTISFQRLKLIFFHFDTKLGLPFSVHLTHFISNLLQTKKNSDQDTHIQSLHMQINITPFDGDDTQ